MKFTKKVLPNGLTILHEKRDVPVATVMLGVHYGAAHESADEKGIAHFIEHLCFKGTEKRTVKQIAEEVEGVGGDLNAFTHEEVTAYHVTLPSRHVDVAMDVIFDIFFNASFPEEEIAKEAGVICEEIKMYHDNPRAHTFEMIKNSLYAPPFGLFIGGSEKTVRSMTRTSLLEKHRSVYVPANSVLTVVGNTDFDSIVALAEKLGVERDSSPSPLPPIVSRVVSGSETRPGVQQTNLALGFHFPFMTDSKRYAVEVFTSILGQGMASKLFTEIREKRGLVYGIKSDVDLGSSYGYMIIWAGTDPENVEEVATLSLSEFSRMKGITQEELSAAKIQAIGSREVESEGSSETALSLFMEEVAGDANDYYSYEDKINSVTLEEIHSLAQTTEHSRFSVGP